MKRTDADYTARSGQESMNLSYWEYRTWLDGLDHVIIGSGIVGLSCALALRDRFPNDKILILETGFLPQGASTKNAGFACFGSMSEILDDLERHTEQEVIDLIRDRHEGLQSLRTLIGNESLQYESLGGYELFLKEEEALYDSCMSNMARINAMLEPLFKTPVFTTAANSFGFKAIQKSLIWNQFEGQLDTGSMMQAMLRKAHDAHIKILNAITVQDYASSPSFVSVKTDKFECKTRNLYIATNGFARDIVEEDLAPARAQVLITKPIPGLEIQGTFHMYKGFNYFRNLEGRILLGGGRHLDLQGEETTKFGTTSVIQEYLEDLLDRVILPDIEFEIESTWSGIMGVGQQKRPIVKAIDHRVFCGIRLGGMGVAIGNTVGNRLADLSIV